MSNGNGGTSLNFLDLLQEFRVVREVAQFAGRAWTWPIAQRADRARSILLIPGFMAGDATLYPFANWLRARGHQVYFSGILANADCPRRAVDRVGRILVELSAKTKGKLVIIGHSLGGIYARELARRFPLLVDQVILMGSPIREPHQHSNPFVKMLASVTQRITGRNCECPGFLPDVCGVNLKAATRRPGNPHLLEERRRRRLGKLHRDRAARASGRSQIDTHGNPVQSRYLAHHPRAYREARRHLIASGAGPDAIGLSPRAAAATDHRIINPKPFGVVNRLRSVNSGGA